MEADRSGSRIIDVFLRDKESMDRKIGEIFQHFHPCTEEIRFAPYE
jgi:hypothetical protein